MEAFPLVALDLPLKLLVWDEGGRVKVAFVPMSETAARYNPELQQKKQKPSAAIKSQRNPKSDSANVWSALEC